MTRRQWQILAWTVGGTVIGAGLLYAGSLGWFIWTMSRTPCGYEIQEQKTSPDGAFKAATVRVNCGATTGHSGLVVVTGVREAIDFEKDRVATFRGEVGHVRWDAGKLVVSYNGIAEPTRMDTHHRGISIAYVNGPDAARETEAATFE